MYHPRKMDETKSPPRCPHVLIIPLPLQGPIKTMMKLAELLCIAGIQVSFLNTTRNHNRLLTSSDTQSHFSNYPHFKFREISDGHPEEFELSAATFDEYLDTFESVAGKLLAEMLVSGSLSSKPPVTCIIAEACLGFPFTVAEEVGIPLVYFETISPSCLWTYFCVNRLIDAGEIPFKGDDLDEPIKSIPGMEDFLRRRDLPNYYRASDMNSYGIQFIKKETEMVPRSFGLILNTFEELDEPLLSRIKSHCPKVYAIGPLHTHLKTKLALPISSSNSFWKEDKTCITWLDAQPPKSVLYFSIGSANSMTKDQLMEFWYGLVDSGKRFLWVRRPDSVEGGFEECEVVPEELLLATEERGCVVSWVPQEEVLAHQAIGGFLTHGGWNSTLESIVEGVPMICWPQYVDQLVDARLVSAVWKIGFDMKDTCDRVVIAKYIKDLMDLKRDEFMQRANDMGKLARKSVLEDGSSFCNMKRLIDDIRSVA